MSSKFPSSSPPLSKPLKLLSLLPILTFLTTTLLSILFFHLSLSKSLLCFPFLSNTYIPFHTNLLSIYSSILFLLLFLLPFTYLSFPSSLFPCFLILSFQFLLGILLPLSSLSLLLHSLCSFLCILSLCTSFTTSHIKLYSSLSLFISEYCLCSWVFSFQCYVLLFSLCNCITFTAFDIALWTKHKEYMHMLVCGIYFAMTMLVLTAYRDIVFVVQFCVLLVGTLSIANTSFWEMVTTTVMLIGAFYAMVVVLIVNGRGVLRYRNRQVKFVPLVRNSAFMNRTLL